MHRITGLRITTKRPHVADLAAERPEDEHTRWELDNEGSGRLYRVVL